jgi:hypothetical protein
VNPFRCAPIDAVAVDDFAHIGTEMQDISLAFDYSSLMEVNAHAVQEEAFKVKLFFMLRRLLTVVSNLPTATFVPRN